MANQEHVEILKKGVDVWNKWREDNPDVKIDLSITTLIGTTLSDADLSDADLSNAILIDANLIGVNLVGANLNTANLRSADLSNVSLRSAYLGNATLIGADLSGTILSDAKLNSANLRSADISNAILFGADLSDATLIDADIRNANLSGTTLRGTNLSGADITGATLYGTVRDYWNIDGIKCDYVYFDNERKERTPKDRNFSLGEFEEIYKWRPHDDFERRIERSIEFPPEYKQAGVSILNYFAEILRKKYPESEATVQIKQDGLKVTMIIDPAKGEREVVEKTLNDYGLVITGKMTPEEFTNDKHQIIELRSELRIAQVRIEMQKELLQDKSAQVDKLLSMVGNAVRTPHHIHINNQASGGNMGDNTINAHDVANGKLVAGNDNIS